MASARFPMLAVGLLAAAGLVAASPVEASHGMTSVKYVTGSWNGFFAFIPQCQGPGGATAYGIGGACMMDVWNGTFKIRVTDDKLGGINFFWEARDNSQARCPATGGFQQGFVYGGLSPVIQILAPCTHVTVFPDIVATTGWVKTENA